MISVSVSVDVPNVVEGIRFYTEAFGFSKMAEPAPGVALLRAGGIEVWLLEKAPGSLPATDAPDTRRYQRHWTPVHLDITVDDLQTALAKAVKAGAKQEQVFDSPEHGSAVFCSDPFGHGFCLIQRKQGAR